MMWSRTVTLYMGSSSVADAVTDHAEYLGIVPAMDIPGTRLNKHPIATAMHSDDVFVRLGVFIGMITGGKDPELHDEEIINTVWMDTVAAATRHNDPGVFTTFAAFEYSASQGEGAMLHRNVLFRGEVPNKAFSSHNSENPEDLWDWMDAQREAGIESLAIPHNPNLSEGWAFKLETFGGDSLSSSYATQRMRNEPLVEVTQIKGSSETHPRLSPNDEWASFEILESFTGAPTEQLNGRYVRDTYRSGLKLEETEGYNPFKFGLIGSSDTHLAGAAYSEEKYLGKFGMLEATAEGRGSVPRNRETGWEDSQALAQTAGTVRFGASLRRRSRQRRPQRRADGRRRPTVRHVILPSLAFIALLATIASSIGAKVLRHFSHRQLHVFCRLRKLQHQWGLPLI